MEWLTNRLVRAVRETMANLREARKTPEQKALEREKAREEAVKNAAWLKTPEGQDALRRMRIREVTQAGEPVKFEVTFDLPEPPAAP